MPLRQKKNGRARRFDIGLVLIVFSATLVFLSLEGALRMIGYGKPAERVDPFHGFEGAPPIFVKEDMAGRGLHYVPRSRLSYIGQSFSVEKKEDVYRVFTFGGSTTEGVPWGRDGSFSHWLEQNLQARHPDKTIQVINVGIAGYGSSRVRQIVKEMVSYSPDLFIVYTGQNEFRDARYHVRELRRSPLQVQFLKVIFSSRVIYLVYERVGLLMQSLVGRRVLGDADERIIDVLSEPFSSRTFRSLDYYRMPKFFGLSEDLIHSDAKRYPENESWSNPRALVKRMIGRETWDQLKEVLGFQELSEQEVYKNFEGNIREMIKVANTHHVKIIFLQKAQNPKTISLLSPDKINRNVIVPGKEDEWKHAYQRAIDLLKKRNCQEALKGVHHVRQLYVPSFRTKDYLLNLYAGECYEQLEHYEQARREYHRRLSQSHVKLNEKLAVLGREYQIPVINVEDVLTRRAANGIVGYNVFVDLVHMTWDGYQFIGEALADFIEEKMYVVPTDPSRPFSPVARVPTLSRNKNEIPQQFLTAELLTSLGWSAFHQGKFETALQRGQEAVALSNDAIQAHLLLGYVHAKRNNEDEALREWNILKKLWMEMEEN